MHGRGRCVARTHISHFVDPHALLAILGGMTSRGSQPPQWREKSGFRLVIAVGSGLLAGMTLACVTPGAAVALDTPAIDRKPGLTHAEALGLSFDECIALLDGASVAVERLDAETYSGVEMPIRLAGPIDGVTVALRGHDELHAVLDCRLAVSLLAWAPTLRAQGITRLEHYSTYRPGSRTGRTQKPSGHSRGLAIDAARFTFADGRMLDVLDSWGAREHGVDPCARDHDPGAAEDQTLRELVCDAIARNLFTVVLTPHHDKAHENHVHLELVPGVDWTYVR
jgi:hypothetical protein